MKTFRFASLLLFMWMIVAHSQQAPVSVSGVVIESATGKPLPRVSLELRPYQPPPPPGVVLPTPAPSAPVEEARYPGITNGDGQFVFRNIPTGRYTLMASRNGYVHSSYGQRGPNGKALSLSVANNQPATGIQLSITRAAAISGHIYDSKGAPFPYVQVNARRVVYLGGRRTAAILGSTYTDDLGAYRIYGLPPGQYLLSAEGETAQQRIIPVPDGLAPPLPGSVVVQGIGGSMLYTADPANQRKPQQRGTGAGTIYFKNATNDREAWPIELRAGDDLKDIDITYIGAPSVPVTFSGLGGFMPVLLQILPTNLTVSVNAQNGVDVPFALVPGSYVVAARATDSAKRPVVGLAAFDVNPANPPTVKLNLNPPTPVSGRVVLEGLRANVTVPDLARATVRLRRTTPMLGVLDITVPISASGAFTASVPIDGDYTIEILNLSSNLRDRYLKSSNNVRVAGQPVSDLEVVLGTGAGLIDGAAVGAAGRALSNVTVVLVPEQRTRLDLYQSVESDTFGRFRFESIAPGKYLLLSWEDVEPDIWFNPEFIRANEDRGKAVTIVEGTGQIQDVAVIPMR